VRKEVIIGSIKVERKFDKKASVFTKWIAEDTSKYPVQALEDFKYWKVAAMIKDENDVSLFYKLTFA
jgi:hypothetical protein